MTMEILYLTAQMQRWLNGRVARHLEAQAAKIKRVKGVTTLGADGPGGLVALDRRGMPQNGYGVDASEGVATLDEAPVHAPSAMLDSENHRVPA
jgi:hypothetical protein